LWQFSCIETKTMYILCFGVALFVQNQWLGRSVVTIMCCCLTKVVASIFINIYQMDFCSNFSFWRLSQFYWKQSSWCFL